MFTYEIGLPVLWLLSQSKVAIERFDCIEISHFSPPASNITYKYRDPSDSFSESTIGPHVERIYVGWCCLKLECKQE